MEKVVNCWPKIEKRVVFLDKSPELMNICIGDQTVDYLVFPIKSRGASSLQKAYLCSSCKKQSPHPMDWIHLAGVALLLLSSFSHEAGALHHSPLHALRVRSQPHGDHHRFGRGGSSLTSLAAAAAAKKKKGAEAPAPEDIDPIAEQARILAANTKLPSPTKPPKQPQQSRAKTAPVPASSAAPSSSSSSSSSKPAKSSTSSSTSSSSAVAATKKAQPTNSKKSVSNSKKKLSSKPTRILVRPLQFCPKSCSPS